MHVIATYLTDYDNWFTVPDLKVQQAVLHFTFTSCDFDSENCRMQPSLSHLQVFSSRLSISVTPVVTLTASIQTLQTNK